MRLIGRHTFKTVYLFVYRRGFCCGPGQITVHEKFQVQISSLVKAVSKAHT